MFAPLRCLRPLVLAVAAACLVPVAARAGSTVRFETVLGSFDLELYDAEMPITVANFLSYVNAGSYNSSIIHRSTTYNPAGIQVVQGGGFALVGNSLFAITTNPPIVFESGTSTNLRGTIAMARGAELDSATSQFYFNVQDNPGLDGGYAVFGKVVGPEGLAVIDAIGALPAYNATEQLGPAFGELPLLNPELTTENVVLINRVEAVPEPSTVVLAAVGLATALVVRRRPARG